MPISRRRGGYQCGADRPITPGRGYRCIGVLVQRRFGTHGTSTMQTCPISSVCDYFQTSRCLMPIKHKKYSMSDIECRVEPTSTNSKCKVFLACGVVLSKSFDLVKMDSSSRADCCPKLCMQNSFLCSSLFSSFRTVSDCVVVCSWTSATLANKGQMLLTFRDKVLTN